MCLDSNRRSRAKRRRDAIISLGGACARCGESDPVVLEIDHILQRDKDSEVKKNGQHNFNEVNRMVNTIMPSMFQVSNTTLHPPRHP